LDGPEWVETLAWVVRMSERDAGSYQGAAAYPDGVRGQTQNPFAQGKLARESSGSWQIQYYAGFPTAVDYDGTYDYDGTHQMPVAPKRKGQEVNWTCGVSFVLGPNSKRIEQGWEFAKFVTGIEGARSIAAAGLELRRRDWATQGVPGEPISVPSPAAYRPAREWQLRELVAKLPERPRRMAEGVFEGSTWAQSRGVLGGLAAVEMWNGFKSAWERAASRPAAPKAALAEARQEAQVALDEAWARIEGTRR
jgi:ABC-type glycerol-3-phosphate transport system substrate-binding protein